MKPATLIQVAVWPKRTAGACVWGTARLTALAVMLSTGCALLADIEERRIGEADSVGGQGGAGQGGAGQGGQGGVAGQGGGEPCLEAGCALWAVAFGDAGDQDARSSLSVDAAGNLVASGAFRSSVTFGGNTHATSGADDNLYVVQLSASGEPVWSHAGGDGGDQGFDFWGGTTFDATGNAIVVGNYGGTLDLGAGSHTAVGARDVFLAKFASDGTPMWSRSYGDGAEQKGRAVAVDSDGDIVIAGFFAGQLDFGGSSGAITSTGNGYDDCFIARLSPDASVARWAVAHGGTNSTHLDQMLTDGLGHVYFSGSYRSAMDFGDGTISNGGGPDLFIAKLDAADGSTLWSRGFPAAQEQRAQGLALDSQGRPVVVGELHGTVDLGDGPRSAGSGIVLGAFDADGSLRWSKSWDGIGVGRIAIDEQDIIYLAARLLAPVDFGAGIYDPGPADDVVVVALDSTGQHLWSRHFGGNGRDRIVSIAVAPDASLRIYGMFEYDLTFDGIELAGNGEDDLFFVSLRR